MSRTQKSHEVSDRNDISTVANNRRQLIEVMYSVVAGDLDFDIHSIEVCPLAYYYTARNIETDNCELSGYTFSPEFVCGHFSISEDTANRLFDLHGSKYPEHVYPQTAAEALKMIVEAFEGDRRE